MKLIAVVLLVGAALIGCSGSDEAKKSDVPLVVTEPALAWASITIAAGTNTVELPPDIKSSVAPMRAARALDNPGPPTLYGLDQPRALLTYRPAAATASPVEIDVGNANFDRHFVYAQRRGQARVYLLPADSFRRVLRLVGIEDRPPE